MNCPSCSAELPAEAQFCDGCGQRIGEVPLSAQERDPRAYTPKHLADKILQSKSALEGERKQVTVLFADVKGSMELAEQVGPEAWRGILERFFQILTDGVHRFEGTVNQYTGDGIMALFGAPIAHEDHAQRACYAALHLRDGLRGYADELRVERGLSFAARIGLNSGEVVVGKIGDDLRMDYTAQGYTVGLASRVEQLAEPGRAFITEDTARLVQGLFQLRDLGGSKLRGVSERVQIYELEDTTGLRTRLDVSRSRGFSRLVGRGDEMATLELALHRAQEGDGQVVGVVGEAGVGKSRLCSEFMDRCRAKQIRVLEAHCPAHGKTVPLLPILELLRNSFEITVRDSDQAAREKIAGRLLLLDRAFDEVLPLVFDFLGVPGPEQPVPGMEPEARRRQLYSFLRRFTQARSDREPAVLLFDDIQWIDEVSEGYLAQLVEATSATRTLLLANFRPEYHAGWMGKSDYQQLSLSPLGPEAIDELLYELLGDDRTVVGLSDLIRERTGGNPFFIEELVQSLAESESLSGTRGAYRLETPMEELAIPDTVHAVLAARIDRLPEREKQVLQTAAVTAMMGKRFSESLLGGVAGLPAPDLAAALSRLQADEFIKQEALYPELEYVFKHPLTQEVAYHTLLSDRRGEIHRAVARGLEEIHAKKLDEHAALIAHHWEEAGEALDAARWHQRAVPWATRTDWSQAMKHWRRMRALAGAAPESSDSLGLVLRACRGILETGWLAGFSSGEAEEAFAEGKALAERSGDLWSQARLALGYASVTQAAGDLAACENYSDQATTLAELAGDAQIRVAAQGHRAVTCWLLGRLSDGLSELDRYVELGTSHAQRLDPRFLRTRGNLLMLLGRLDEAQDEAEKLVRLVGEKRNPASLMPAYLGRAELGYFVGDAASSLSAAQELMRVIEKLPMARMLSIGHLWLGVAHIRHEAWEPAIDEVEQALSIARQSRNSLAHEAQTIAYLAEANLGGGESQRARELAMEGVTLARSQGARPIECQAQITLARALAKSENADRTEEAKAALDRARELAEDMGARPFEAQIHEASAELAALLGDDADSARELREAHRLYTEIGATGHAERMARELARA